MQKLALVTGAARGIGLETTRVFLREGWNVAMIDRDGDVLAQEAAKSASAPARCSRYSRIVSRKCSLGFVIMVSGLVKK